MVEIRHMHFPDCRLDTDELVHWEQHTPIDNWSVKVQLHVVVYLGSLHRCVYSCHMVGSPCCQEGDSSQEEVWQRWAM